MSLPIKLDHCVIHVSVGAFQCLLSGCDGGRGRDKAGGLCLPLRRQAAQCARARVKPAEVARLPVAPGNSDLCFEWHGPIADAVAHLQRHKIAIHAGPLERFGAKGRGTSVYFYDPDGSLMEFMSYVDKLY